MALTEARRKQLEGIETRAQLLDRRNRADAELATFK